MFGADVDVEPLRKYSMHNTVDYSSVLEYSSSVYVHSTKYVHTPVLYKTSSSCALSISYVRYNNTGSVW